MHDSFNMRAVEIAEALHLSKSTVTSVLRSHRLHDDYLDAALRKEAVKKWKEEKVESVVKGLLDEKRSILTV